MRIIKILLGLVNLGLAMGSAQETVTNKKDKKIYSYMGMYFVINSLILIFDL